MYVLHTSTLAHKNTLTCTHVHTHACICTCTHKLTHTHTHTRAYAHQVSLANELGLPLNVHSRSAGHHAIDALLVRPHAQLPRLSDTTY
jgi:Tat protein secretion system quality control protein TatD with DNase activity